MDVTEKLTIFQGLSLRYETLLFFSVSLRLATSEKPGGADGEADFGDYVYKN
jgi:hypothetical protein